MRQVLSGLPVPQGENILAAFDNAEDAAVYRLSDDRALVVSIDVITPLVDDAQTFGRISAANSFSDIYAMGGESLLALSFLGTPKDFPLDIAADILRGGAEFATEAGAPILGGHTVESQDLMFGLCAVGLADPKHLFANDQLKVGDQLILTKPLGTGGVTTALKGDHISEADAQPAIDGMMQSNAAAVAPLKAAGVRGVTDVTGFALMGHAAEMAKASKVQVVFDQASVPAYPQARELLAAGHRTRGNKRNPPYVKELGPVVCAPGIDEPEYLLYDPQTSGGLLAAVKADQLDAVIDALRSAGFESTVRVGEIREGSGLLVQ